MSETAMFDPDVIVLRTDIPEGRWVQGLEYGTVVSRGPDLYRYVRIKSGLYRGQWLAAKHACDVDDSDGAIMRAIRDELRSIDRAKPRPH